MADVNVTCVSVLKRYLMIFQSKHERRLNDLKRVHKIQLSLIPCLPMSS